MSLKLIFAMFSLFIFLFEMEIVIGARRKCESDCDCKMHRGQRCVFKVRGGEEIKMVHCSLRPADLGGFCRCRKGCMSVDGTFIRNKRTIIQECRNITCVKARKNKIVLSENTC